MEGLPVGDGVGDEAVGDSVAVALGVAGGSLGVAGGSLGVAGEVAVAGGSVGVPVAVGSGIAVDSGVAVPSAAEGELAAVGVGPAGSDQLAVGGASEARGLGADESD